MTDTQEVARLKAEISDLEARLTEARAALLAERFKDVPQRSVGDRVLVARKLFGKTKWWPAVIAGVHLDYSEGTFRGGEEWTNHHVSYSVQHELPDGSLNPTTEGYWEKEVQDVPALGEEN